MDDATAALAIMAAIAAVIQEFEDRVAEATSDAYLSLARLGIADDRIVDLLGLRDVERRQAGTSVVQAA